MKTTLTLLTTLADPSVCFTGVAHGPVGVQHAPSTGSVPADTAPGTYLPIKRRWQSGDVIELRLPLGLRVRPSMDDPVTVSLFYGPVILAGELGRDQMPASDIAGKDAFVKAPAWPVPVFVSATPGQASLPVRPLPDAPLRFEARMFNPVNRQEVRVRLAPLHRVHHQRFAVYWKVVAPEQK